MSTVATVHAAHHQQMHQRAQQHEGKGQQAQDVRGVVDEPALSLALHSPVPYREPGHSRPAPTWASLGHGLWHKREIDRWHEPARCEAIEEWARWNNLFCQPDARTLDLTCIERVGQRRRADRGRICLSMPGQAHSDCASCALYLDDEAVPVVARRSRRADHSGRGSWL
jgi:hypothetical protein